MLVWCVVSVQIGTLRCRRQTLSAEKGGSLCTSTALRRRGENVAGGRRRWPRVERSRGTAKTFFRSVTSRPSAAQHTAALPNGRSRWKPDGGATAQAAGRAPGGGDQACSDEASSAETDRSPCSSEDERRSCRAIHWWLHEKFRNKCHVSRCRKTTPSATSSAAERTPARFSTGGAVRPSPVDFTGCFRAAAGTQSRTSPVAGSAVASRWQNERQRSLIPASEVFARIRTGRCVSDAPATCPADSLHAAGNR